MTDRRTADDLRAQRDALVRSWQILEPRIVELEAHVASLLAETALLRRGLQGLIARVDRMDDELESGIRPVELDGQGEML